MRMCPKLGVCNIEKWIYKNISFKMTLKLNESQAVTIYAESSARLVLSRGYGIQHSKINFSTKKVEIPHSRGAS